MSDIAPSGETFLYERKVRVAADTQLIENLRVSFKVKKTLKKEPNTCEVQIYNLSEASRAALQKTKRINVIVEAGYTGNIAQIFSGVSRYVDQVLEKGGSWASKIQCGDGEREFHYRRVAKSFGPGTRVYDVVKGVSDSLGLTTQGLDQVQGLSEQFVNGYTAMGKASGELDRLLKNRGFEWSIQDGQVQVLSQGGTTQDTMIQLAPGTGLIGSPEHGNPEKEAPLAQFSGLAEDQGFSLTAAKRKGPAVLKVKSLLQPGLKPGRKVKVVSRGVDGIFRIETVTHTGDTHGGEWYSELECLPTA